MRLSETLINLAAAAALVIAAGSLWHAYKVRFGDDTEHASSVEASLSEMVTPAAALEPTAASPTPVAGAATDSPATAPVAPPAAPIVDAPETPAPAAPAPAIEIATPTVMPTVTPVTTPARVSLRDPRELPATAAAPEPPARALQPVMADDAKTSERAPLAWPTLSDRRELVAPRTAAPGPPSDITTRTDIADLRDPRQIVAAPPPETRTVNNTPGETAPRQIVPTPEVQIASATTAPPPPPGTTCGPHSMTTEAREGGMMRLAITSSCRANQDVQLAYGGAVLIRRLDSGGHLEFALDCFDGAASDLLVTFADGNTERRPVVAQDLDKLSKVAVIWSAPVNLDLHAFEYSAGIGKAGHVWERAASMLVTAREIAAGSRRGRGYLSTGDDGRGLGDKLEVYTFLHQDEQASGVVAMGLDYETRGEVPSGMTCGNGAFAAIRYQVVTRGRRGQTARENGILSAAPCGAKIGSQVRFDPFLLPAIRVQQ